jgi:hypothetical protein
VESEEARAAEAALQEARRALIVWQAQSEATASEEKTAEATQRVEDAQAALDACYTSIVVRALPPSEFEALYDEYPPYTAPPADPKNPPTEEEKQAAADAKRTAEEAYLRAVFLASVEDDDMTAEDWEAFFAEDVSTGERNDLYDLANTVNTRPRTPAGHVPKG